MSGNNEDIQFTISVLNSCEGRNEGEPLKTTKYIVSKTNFSNDGVFTYLCSEESNSMQNCISIYANEISERTFTALQVHQDEKLTLEEFDRYKSLEDPSKSISRKPSKRTSLFGSLADNSHLDSDSSDDEAGPSSRSKPSRKGGGGSCRLM